MTSKHLLLYRLTELMLEHEQQMLPVDLLFDDAQIGDFVKNIQIDSPYQQMLFDGVLTESVREEKIFVSFTVEGYFHFVLGEVIYKRTQGLGADTLKQIVEENKLNGAKEGVEQCLIRDVQKDDLTRLTWLIDESDLALELAVLPLAMAFISIEIKFVLRNLLISPSYNDLILLEKVCLFFEIILKDNISDEIKRGLNEMDNLEKLIIHPAKIENAEVLKEQIKLFNNLNIKLSDNSKEILINKISDFISFFLNNDSGSNTDCLVWISVLVDLNVLDKAKEYIENFIENAVKCKNQNALVVALEQLGESEYKRAGKNGYEAAITALTRAAQIRESEYISQQDNLIINYRLLAFSYLSLGMQLVKATEFFEKAKAISLKHNSESDELAELKEYMGLVYFWRGLRAKGRWGHKDEDLLLNLNDDPFEIAIKYFQEALEIRFKNQGKIHPKSLKLFHYLQETSYGLGNYLQAIPWLELYVSILPTKNKEHTDYFYYYSLVVSLEEYAKQIAISNPDKALTLIQNAFKYIENYDEADEIANRLTNVKEQIEAGKIEVPVYPKIEDLPPLETETHYKGIWSKWQFSEELKGFQTNNWMVAAHGVWFFNGEKKQLVFWDKEINSLSTFNPTEWPEGCGRIIFDQKNRIFYAWSSIRSTVYKLTDAAGSWNRLSFGVHDVHACGASYAFDPVNNRLFEFGGYGYFTYKNWLWVYDISEKKWIQLKENKPGISPYPRNGQLLPINNGTKAILISGIGSDTGIQREHKARFGLASATDVGYFTWLRDAHELDLVTMEWRTVMAANHNTIRHEGSMGLIADLNLVVNWGGTIPSPEFGIDAVNCEQCSCAVLSESPDFKNLEFKGEYPPFTGGYFQMIPGLSALLFIHQDGIWNFELNDG